MSPHFHPDDYPHIMDEILSHLPRRLLLRLRLVNSSFRSMIDRELTRGVMAVKKLGEVTVMTTTTRELLPFSRPGSRLPSRTRFLSTTLMISSDVSPSNRVRKLLQVLPEDCRINLDHSYGYRSHDYGFGLPQTAPLQVRLGIPCDCALRSKPFQHASRSVTVIIESYRFTPQPRSRPNECQVVSGLLTPNVVQLRILADSKEQILYAFGWVKGFKGYQRSKHHKDLRIVVSISQRLTDQALSAAMQEFADLFEVDEDRIAHEPLHENREVRVVVVMFGIVSLLC